MDFDITRLFTIKYYFEPNPAGDFLPGYILLIFFFFVVFSGTIMKKKSAKNKYLKKSIKKRLWKFIPLGILGIVLVTARFSAVPIISMRAWLYIILITTIGIGVQTAVHINRDYKKRLSSVAREKKKREK